MAFDMVVPLEGVSERRGVPPAAAAVRVDADDEGDNGCIGDGGGRGIVRDFVGVDEVDIILQKEGNVSCTAHHLRCVDTVEIRWR